MNDKISKLNEAIKNAQDETIKGLLKDALKVEEKRLEQKNKERRYWARQKLILQKAEKAGIKVSEQEIDVEVEKMVKKSK
jgi:hypothetical protein